MYYEINGELKKSDYHADLYNMDNLYTVIILCCNTVDLLLAAGIYLSAVLVTYAMADLYAPDSGVVELTSDTFVQNVLCEDSGLWVVNFYAPWCPYSRNFTTEYSKAAKALNVRINRSYLM